MYQGNPHAKSVPAVAFRIARAPPHALRKAVPARPASRIAHALRRGAVSCETHPKTQPPKLHPQIGCRRFTPARGGQVPWERRRARRHTVQPRPRRIGTLGAPTSSSAHGSARQRGQVHRTWISRVGVLVSSGSVAWTETCIIWLRALPLVSPEEEDGSKTKPSAACAGSRSCVPRWGPVEEFPRHLCPFLLQLSR